MEYMALLTKYSALLTYWGKKERIRSTEFDFLWLWLVSCWVQWNDNVLQCVAVCCSVLQCVAVCCSVLQCVAVCCSVLQERRVRFPLAVVVRLLTQIKWVTSLYEWCMSGIELSHATHQCTYFDFLWLRLVSCGVKWNESRHSVSDACHT